MNQELDYYLVHKAQQPKKEIADYVASEGIRVPKRFYSLQDALTSNLPFIIRSEHPQDYDGVSGLLSSKVISSGRKRTALMKSSQTEVEQSLLDEHKALNVYCFLTGVESGAFVREVSYSYWELIEGQDRVIVADSAIAGRYHIFTSEANQKVFENEVTNYSVYENGAIVLSTPDDLQPELAADFPKLVTFYEDVRHLGRFDPSHCPIIETQTDKGDVYFLQYHRTRNFTGSTFTLDRTPEADEVEAVFVRGATSPSGRIYKTRGGDLYKDQSEIAGECDLDTGEASFGIHWGDTFNELMCRKRGAEFIVRDLSQIAVEATHDHPIKSRLFKPGVSVVLDRQETIAKIFSRYPEFDSQGGWCSLPPYINIRAISDGRRALIKPVI